MKIYIYLSDEKWIVSESKTSSDIIKAVKTVKAALKIARKIQGDRDILILEFGKWIDSSKSKHVAKADGIELKGEVAKAKTVKLNTKKASTSKKGKLHKVYITVRKNKEHDIIGWFIVDKESPVDFQFNTKVEALDYVKKNYEDVIVMVQNHLAKFQYTIVLENKKIVSFKSKGKEDLEDKTTTVDLQKIFDYDEKTVKTTKTYKKSIFHRKQIVHPSCQHIEEESKNKKVLKKVVLLVKHKGNAHYSVMPYVKQEGYEENDEYQNAKHFKTIRSEALSQTYKNSFKTKALALAFIETKYKEHDIFYLTAHKTTFLDNKDGYAKQMADPNSDAHIMAHNEHLTKADLVYFEARKAQYYGYEFPTFNRTLFWGSAFAVISLIVSIFAFALNAGVGISRNYYAAHITANRWEFLVPAFLLLIWPAWMIIRLFLTSSIVNKIQRGFARKPKYTHKYIMRRINVIGLIHTAMTGIVAFISIGWLIAFLSTSSDLLTELSYISIFVIVKIVFIIIPKSFVFFISLREAVAAKKWAKEHDFAKSVVLLAYLYFEKRTSTSHAIIGKYDFNGVSGTSKILTDFYTYKQRGVTMDYLFKVTARTLTDKERSMIEKRTVEFKKSLEDEAAIYARIVDAEGRIIWN